MCVHHKSPPVLEGMQMKEMGGSSHGLIDGFNFRMALNINCLWLKEVTVYYYYGTAPAPLLLTIQYIIYYTFTAVQSHPIWVCGFQFRSQVCRIVITCRYLYIICNCGYLGVPPSSQPPSSSSKADDH